MNIKISFSRFFIVCLFFQLIPMLSLVAQVPLTIQGKVVDERSQPLQGVSISLKNKQIATVSNAKGEYTLKVPVIAGSVLVFTHVGFSSTDVALTQGKVVYDIQLTSNSQELNDVVVVGYGTIRKKDLTGSVGSVNIKDLQKAQVVSFDQAFAGRVAGVQVSANDGQPGSNMSIVIRGNNSISQTNSPLYVVDGFPIETNLNSMLSPSDIESIEVLKDASATAIYGARGANGVIIITTKKGVVGSPVINFQSSYGLQNVIKRLDVMDPFQFVSYQMDLNPTMYSPIYLSNGRTLDSYKTILGVNWQDLLFREAPILNNAISMTGGTAQTKYAISGSVLGQEGVVVNGGYDRVNGRIVVDQFVGKNAKVGVNINYTSSKSYGTRVGAALTSPTSTMMYSIWGYRPVAGSDVDDAGLMELPYDPNVDPTTDLRYNPLITAKNTYNPTITNTIFANAYLDYNLLKNLKLRVTGGMTTIESNTKVFNNSFTQSGNPITSVNGVNGSITNSRRANFLNENTITYAPKIGNDHTLTVLGGFTTQKEKYESSGFTAIQVPNESLGISGLDEGIVTKGSSSMTSNTLASFLGRINYSYKSKYLLTASFRADGSSKFSAGNKWAQFPSASFAWRIKDEKFMDGLKFISDAKIRGSYGLTGNNRVSDFAYLSSYQINAAGGYTYNNSTVQGIIPIDLGTKDLKWETTAQSDFGLDLGFLQNRIQFTADYYEKITSDLLLNASIAPSMGYLSGYKNVGKVSNRGFEFTLNTRNIETKNFTWSSSFNISFNTNKVLQLNDGQANLQTAITWGNYSSAPYIAIPGQAIAQFNGYVFDGVYQYSDFDLVGSVYTLKAGIPNNGLTRAAIQPGHIKYKDLNGDTVVNASDITTIGNPTPKHIGGFSNNFTYRGFDLNIFFQWSYGNDLMNVNRLEFEGGEPRNYLNQFATFANRWTPANPSNTLYRAGGQGNAVYSSRIIEDGSYLRLKTMAIGYSIPEKLLKKAKIKNLRFYASAQNLMTWTNYTGVDPEVSVRNSALTPGFDLSAYPQTKTFTFGLNLTL